MLAPEDFPKDRCDQTLVNTWPCPRCCVPCNLLLHPFRKAVSRHKRRFQQGGFDLDLTYLTDRIIVMGFPATGIEHLYRNPRYELRRFFETRHRGHYKVYNLACEPGRGYPVEVFSGYVERYPWRDHGVPLLETMLEATNSAKRFLDQDASNVVAFHCKAGKGRAGLMASCMAIRCGAFDTATEALAHYDKTRVSNGKGLTIPSQIKYVKLFERVWREKWGISGSLGTVSYERAAELGVPEQPRVFIRSIRLENLREHEKLLRVGQQWRARLVVRVYKGTMFDPILLGEATQESSNSYTFSFSSPIAVEENYCVAVLRVETFACSRGQKTLMELWENTAFLPDVIAGELSFSLDACDMKKKLRRCLGHNVKVVLTVLPQHEENAPMHATVVSSDGSPIASEGVELTSPHRQVVSEDLSLGAVYSSL